MIPILRKHDVFSLCSVSFTLFREEATLHTAAFPAEPAFPIGCSLNAIDPQTPERFAEAKGLCAMASQRGDGAGDSKWVGSVRELDDRRSVLRGPVAWGALSGGVGWISTKGWTFQLCRSLWSRAS